MAQAHSASEDIKRNQSMAPYLVAYDVTTPFQDDVKNELLRSGFIDRVPITGGSVIRLPNTTVVVEAESTQDALSRFIAIAESATFAGVVERAIAVPARGYWAVGDRAK